MVISRNCGAAADNKNCAVYRETMETGPGYAVFTLIELLVVVAIIAILAALLLPALRTARLMAHSSVCRSNLKQLSICTFNYADDNKGFTPYQVTPALKNIMFYKPPFDVYVKGPKITVVSGGMGTVLPKISICPAGKRFDDDAAPSTNANFSYGYNIAFGYVNTGYTNLSLYKVKQPSKKFFIGDTTANATAMAQRSDFAYRHTNCANIIFVDSHVEALRYADVPATTSENNGFYYDK